MVSLPSSCVFPNGLDETAFLKSYWQQSPLLLPQAFPNFETPLPADELAGLSLEPDTSGRLIVKDQAGDFRLEHGPFDESRFATLGNSDWSLLVTDVEKHIPEIRPLLAAFSFLPSWRIDDIMISYAPDGASVGAHVDDYDVFLLQASGQRQWLIEDSARDHKQSSQGDLRLVEDFAPTQDLLLSPGDILYLPPGIAHHGIAIGDECTTWSIGFRAPAADELVLKLSELIADRISLSAKVPRYRDPPLSPAVPGEIDTAAIQRFEKLWQDATNLAHENMAELIGTMLTLDGGSFHNEHSDTHAQLQNQGEDIQRNPFSQMLWHGIGKSVTLHADGQAYHCSRKLAIALCAMQSPTSILSIDSVGEQDQEVIQQLRSAGVLVSSS